jgi:hypothetical protein
MTTIPKKSFWVAKVIVTNIHEKKMGRGVEGDVEELDMYVGRLSATSTQMNDYQLLSNDPALQSYLRGEVKSNNGPCRSAGG